LRSTTDDGDDYSRDGSSGPWRSISRRINTLWILGAAAAVSLGASIAGVP
jgi:hypothetical protein